MPVHWNPRCPICNVDSLECRRPSLCDDPLAGHRPYGSLEDLRCPHCGWRQCTPSGTCRPFLAPHEVGAFYGLAPSTPLPLDVGSSDDTLPYDGNASTGEPSIEELEARCLHFTPYPVPPGVISRDRALELAGWQAVQQRSPDSRAAARFGLLTHDHWYQEVPGRGRIDFVRRRLVWPVTFVGHTRYPLQDDGTPPPSPRVTTIVDAESGRHLLQHSFF